MAKTAFEKYQNDHEVQMVLTTMYQTKLDQANVNPDLTIEKYCELTEVNPRPPDPAPLGQDLNLAHGGSFCRSSRPK